MAWNDQPKRQGAVPRVLLLRPECDPDRRPPSDSRSEYFDRLSSRALEAVRGKCRCLADIGIAFGDRHQNTKPPNPVWLLRVSGQRPCCRRTAQNFDELAPPH